MHPKQLHCSAFQTQQILDSKALMTFLDCNPNARIVKPNFSKFIFTQPTVSWLGHDDVV